MIGIYKCGNKSGLGNSNAIKNKRKEINLACVKDRNQTTFCSPLFNASLWDQKQNKQGYFDQKTGLVRTLQA
jgi:hypothetical protein